MNPTSGGRDGPLWTHQKFPRGGRVGRYGQIWLKNSCFRGPLRPSRFILVCAKGCQWPPQMWATIFNHVQPVLNQFEAGRATYGQISQNMAKNGRFGGPLRPPTVILVGVKGSEWPIPVVGYNVQPGSTSVLPN